MSESDNQYKHVLALLAKLDDELIEHTDTNRKNLEVMKSLQTDMIAALDPVFEAEVNEIKLAKFQMLQNETEKLVSECEALSLQKQKSDEQKKASKTIQLLEVEIENLNGELKKVQKENYIHKQSTKDLMKKLQTGFRSYAKCGLKVDIEPSGDTYSCKLYSSKHADRPVMFVFDEKQRKILSFDASRLLTSEEESRLQALFAESRNEVKLLNTLSKIMVKK